MNNDNLEKKIKIDYRVISNILGESSDKEMENMRESMIDSLIKESYKYSRTSGYNTEDLLESANSNKSPELIANSIIDKLKSDLISEARKDSKLSESIMNPRISKKLLLERYFTPTTKDASPTSSLRKLAVLSYIENLLDL
jgi:hypothetical protein